MTMMTRAQAPSAASAASGRTRPHPARGGRAAPRPMAAELAPRVAVLGDGLAGLVSALLLQRSLPRARITVLGKRAAGQRAGLIRSSRGSGGHICESGPHNSILVDKNGRELLGLIKLVGLDEDVVSANIENSARRHLFHYGRVQLFPRVQHILRFCPPLLAEPLWRRGRAEDESVHAFVARRASRDVADRIADPICRGMFAGDARQLSVRTCFPRLWFNERRFRSVFIGSMLSTFSAYRRRSWLSLDLLDPLLQRVSAGGRCYTLRNGLGSLLDRLEDRLAHPTVGTRPVEFAEEPVRVQRFAGQRDGAPQVELQLPDGRLFEADAVVATMPPPQLAALLEVSGLAVATADGDGGAVTALRSVRHESLAVVNVSFDTDVLQGKFRGAGYFVGSLEKEPILGMSWDSMMFPTLPGKPHLTVYVAGGAASTTAQAEDKAMQAVRQHLGVEVQPSEVLPQLWHETLPQYEVGHRQRMRDFNAARLRHFPWLHVAGAGYFGTRGAADEVVDARELVDSLSRRFARFPALVENEVEEDVAARYGSGFDAA